MKPDDNAPDGAGASMPPRDRLVRAVFDPPMTFRADQNDGTLGVLTGHFAVFNQPTEINSIFEGHFMERIAPGAFKKTFRENGDRIKVLYDHGHDPSVGNKPLGVPSSLSEDSTGARYEVPLFDTSYNRDLIPALKAGALGASFRFQVLREDVVQKPKRSAANPDGIPERTILEAKVAEFGPVTFPAYAGATAGMRSMTDEYLLASVDLERLERLLASQRTSVAITTAIPTRDEVEEIEEILENADDEEIEAVREVPEPEPAEVTTSVEPVEPEPPEATTREGGEPEPAAVTTRYVSKHLPPRRAKRTQLKPEPPKDWRMNKGESK